MSGFAAAATKPTEAVVHPLVLLNCVDHYNRVAKNTSKRVVGVLLGRLRQRQGSISSAFSLKLLTSKH